MRELHAAGLPQHSIDKPFAHLQAGKCGGRVRVRGPAQRAGELRAQLRGQHVVVRLGGGRARCAGARPGRGARLGADRRQRDHEPQLRGTTRHLLRTRLAYDVPNATKTTQPSKAVLVLEILMIALAAAPASAPTGASATVSPSCAACLATSCAASWLL